MVSAYPLDQCPDYVDAVMIAVSAEDGRAVWIGDSGDAGHALSRRLEAAARRGAGTVHVHLLAEGAAARRAVIADLRAAALAGGSVAAATAGEVRLPDQEGRQPEQDEQRRQH